MAQRENAHLSSDERAYQEIRDMIVEGDLKPGTQIVQEALAERLGLSRTPLRKAIATLTQENFLETDTRGAAFVRSFNDEELTSIWEIRAVLEGLVCRFAAQRIQPEHLAYLRSLITSAAEKTTPQDWTAYRKADVHFHNYLAEVVDDQHLTKILDSFQILSLTLARGLLRPPKETLPEHLEILDALREQDADSAEQGMVNHIRASIQYLRRIKNGMGGESLGTPSEAHEYMARSLAHELQETTVVAVEKRKKATVVYCEQGQRALRISVDPGTRLPLHATAAGKVLLAWKDQEELKRSLRASNLERFTPNTITDDAVLHTTLEDIQRKGYAVEDEEHKVGIRSVAAPILSDGHIIGVVAVLIPTARMDMDACRALSTKIMHSSPAD